MTLSEYNQRYETIMQGDFSTDQKDLMLSSLMSELEVAFNIPMIRKPEWEEKHKKIIALYRKISLSREL